MRSFIDRKRKERKLGLEKRLAEAREDCRSIIDMIIAGFHPDKIYRWGSLVHGEGFQEISDIDIAVAGITEPEPFLRLCEKAIEMTSFPLHIVQIEMVHPAYLHDILENGELVYERPVR